MTSSFHPQESSLSILFPGMIFEQISSLSSQKNTVGQNPKKSAIYAITQINTGTLKPQFSEQVRQTLFVHYIE